MRIVCHANDSHEMSRNVSPKKNINKIECRLLQILLDALGVKTDTACGLIVIRAAPCENVSSGICGQRWPRSACASAQSDQGLHCSITESLDTIECLNGEQMPG